MRVVVPLAVLASLLGLSQAFYGYFQYEGRWFRLVAESSARPDIRPFAFFCAWGEYPFYVATALLVVLVPLARGNGLAISRLLAPLFILRANSFSVGESIFESIFAVSMVWAMRARSAGAVGGRLILALIVGGGAMVIGMTQLKEVDINEQVNKQLNHTADGFVDIENSSAGIHLELVGIGITAGFSHPFGYGLGFPTVAGLKAGGFSSEIDFSDVFISCGFVVGLFYLFFIFVVLRQTIRYWRGQRNPVALYVLALYRAWNMGHWLAGGLYAVCPLTWFAIGVLDRASSPASPRPATAQVAVGHTFRSLAATAPRR